MSKCFMQGELFRKNLTQDLQLKDGLIVSSETEGLKIGDFIFANAYFLGILKTIIDGDAKYEPIISILNLN